MIKAIIFDLSGVLFTNGLKIGIDKIHRKYGLNKEHLKELLDGDSSTAYRLSKISPKQFWQNIQDQLFLTDSEVEDIKSIWFSSYQIIPEMIDLLKKLNHLGINRYYLSDNPEDRAKYLDQEYGFIKLFNGGVFSHQAHFRKPSAEIFEFLLKDIETPVDQILYLDDKASNLDPAKNLGLETYLFENIEAFIEHLGREYKIYLD